ncbi:MAG: bifunctional glutamate N-acetyltransferase/amino-acid acetyltransferase ArgJ [Alphaproteobacteria bacterium]|nr:bifunctional glutamate N-acetyltransferase/amino-acid acetyltransferase ArgJ [Alphaproteobacteria bacterium]
MALRRTPAPPKPSTRKAEAKSLKSAKAAAAPSTKRAAKKPAKPSLPPAKTHAVSPLAPKIPTDLPPLAGVRFASGEAGVRYAGRRDVLYAVFAPETQVAGVFTRSKTASAPVTWCRMQLLHGTARALVVNSGNANAFTGAAGLEAVRAVAEAGAAVAEALPSQVFIASTGVIGEPLPSQRIIKVLPEIHDRSAATGWLDAAKAIMTTDTYPKLASVQARIDGAKVTINGIAKGSGMIAPDMATMLAFLFTDAAIPSPVLQTLLKEAADDSFNCITVDSDTSTSDTLLAFATGKGARHQPILKAGDRRLDDFRQKLNQLTQALALQVVKDGEGARKLITVKVTGAADDAAAKRIALAIGNSPLVKTAIAGEDANWGRVVMAVGKSGEAADRDRLSIAFGPHLLAKDGQRASGYNEAKVSAYMNKAEIDILVDVGIGKGAARIWTCDLTEGYIQINGAYRS